MQRGLPHTYSEHSELVQFHLQNHLHTDKRQHQ
ncbi:hypothetical protein PF003_g928 [Phytophthora fragariae]|nr:hypothetical protein PF003_g928 [Phytophthora fragariae]